jgi:hypothetical protein
MSELTDKKIVVILAILLALMLLLFALLWVSRSPASAPRTRAGNSTSTLSVAALPTSTVDILGADLKNDPLGSCRLHNGTCDRKDASGRVIETTTFFSEWTGNIMGGAEDDIIASTEVVRPDASSTSIDLYLLSDSHSPDHPMVTLLGRYLMYPPATLSDIAVVPAAKEIDITTSFAATGIQSARFEKHKFMIVSPTEIKAL